MATVVNVKVAFIRPRYNNLKEWMADPTNIYIGRRGVVFIDRERYPPKDSIFANPYKIGRDGNRDEVIVKYEDYIIEKIERGEISHKEIEDLRGKALGCWCHPEPCHGDILLRILHVWDDYING